MLQPAEPGTLEREVGGDVALLHAFAANRERAMVGLFGRRMRISPARDELLRLIVLAFSEGRLCRTSYYRECCSYFESGQAVSREIGVLESSGLVVLQPDPRFARARIVVPTRRLVEFYNTQMPRLRAEVGALLRQAEQAEAAGLPLSARTASGALPGALAGRGSRSRRSPCRPPRRRPARPEGRAEASSIRERYFPIGFRSKDPSRLGTEAHPASSVRGRKSFLVLFFKKEPLPSLPSSRSTPRKTAPPTPLAFPPSGPMISVVRPA